MKDNTYKDYHKEIWKVVRVVDRQLYLGRILISNSMDDVLDLAQKSFGLDYSQLTSLKDGMDYTIIDEHVTHYRLSKIELSINEYRKLFEG